MAPAGEPKESPKPQPIGNLALIVLLTTCTMCGLFLLWRRADGLKRIVSHQMKTWTRQEGAIRLSEDDGPAATQFLSDDPADDDDDMEWDNGDDEPLPPGVTIDGLDSSHKAMNRAAASKGLAGQQSSGSARQPILQFSTGEGGFQDDQSSSRPPDRNAWA
ncbi:hypothetical protein BDN72DRAFT_474989 [Pluteus cervinus]|uniref:Uncharacterized protein n=1 Tax=Pluteus cervinus TaxID=181527 RepID=A0ACD3B005_9AGAR|nr:hypothetical protein BDN72DRAFT_474989 [Pluteus cervinus]